MEKQTGFETLRLALVGKEKSGKSRLAVTAPKPVLVMDFDGRKESIAGIPGVYAITYRDEAWPKQPSGYSDFLDDLSKLEKEASLADLGFSSTEHPATVIADSVTSLSRLIMNYELYTNTDIRRSIKVGGYETFFPKNFDAWNAEMSTMEAILLRLLGLPLHVIITLHETAEEAPDSTLDKPRYTGRVTPFPARHGRLLRYFNEVWRVERNGKIPTVQTVPDYYFTAATNLLIDKVDKPDITDLIRLHTEAYNKGRTNASKS